MTSAILSSEIADSIRPASVAQIVESDTIPRIKIRDLLSGAQFVARNRNATLDSLRVKLNTDRRSLLGGTAGYSVARDVASEMDRLGYAKVGPLPKDAKGFEKKRDTAIRLSEAGAELAKQLRIDRSAAYLQVLTDFYGAHPYVRRFLAATKRHPFLSPVVTSAKQHVSPQYTSAKVLSDEIAEGRFDVEGLLERTAARIDRTLTGREREEIENGLGDLLTKLRGAAAREPQTEFTRKLLMAINEIVVPAVLRDEGLVFDFNTLRRLWLMGAEFQICWATSAHPQYDAWLTFETATIELSGDQSTIVNVRFENGARRLAADFLDRLFDAYSLMQSWGQPSVVTAWELRATFCFQNRCAPGVFDHLFHENYGGSDIYRIEKDFAPRNKPAHEDALRIGGREIGLIRISKR